jgi:hypothetical protein
VTERLGDAVLELRTDDREFLTGIERARGRAEQLGQRFDRIGRGMRQIGTRATIAITGSLGALTLLTRRSVTAADEIGKTAHAINISAEALQEWRFAAGRAGLEASELDRGLIKFTRTLGEAARGNRTQAAIFDELGVSIRDADGRLRDVDSVLGDVARALSGMEESAAANAIAMEIFADRSGRMAKFLAQGSDEIERLRAKARELGVVLSDDLIARSEVAADQIGDLQQVLAVTGMAIGLEFMPVLQELAQLLTSPEFLEGVRGFASGLTDLLQWFRELDPATMKWVAIVAGIATVLGPAIVGLGLLVAGLGAIIPVLASVGVAIAGMIAASGPIGAFILITGAIVAAWQTWGDDITRIISQTVEAIRTWIVEKLGAVWDWLGEKIEWVERKFAWLYDRVIGNSWIPDLVTETEVWMDRLGDSMAEGAGEAAEKTESIFEGMGREITSGLRQILADGRVTLAELGDYAVSVFQRLADRALESALKPLEEAIDNLIDKIVDGLGSALSGLGSGGGGGLGSILSSLFSGFFAEGGLIPAGSFGIVGERGPEPVIGTPRGAVVLPNSSLGAARPADRDGGGSAPAVTVAMNITTPDAETFRRSRGQITAEMARAIDRGRRNL